MLTGISPGNLPSPELAYSNHIYVSPKNYQTLKAHSKSSIVYVHLKGYIFILNEHKGVEDDKVALGKYPRMYMKLAYTDTVDIVLYNPPAGAEQSLSSATCEVELGMGPKDSRIEIDDKELDSYFRRVLQHQFFAPNQVVLVDIKSCILICRITKTQLMNLGVKTEYGSENVIGKMIDETSFEFECKPSANFSIRGQSASRARSIFKSDFKFEDMGVGGLDKEITDIFRRAFTSRRFSPHLLAKYGSKHVRGMLLFGPPGTGKTLIARQLAKVLRSKEPKIVNGPELYDKYVGETERKIRELFSEAIQDEKRLGPESPLHIIVFDEFDAICKARGTVGGGSGVNDTAVNMLLSMIDGVNSLNNILVIGMTNRKDMIDEAILRPGRFEVHIEVSLPDEKGRQQIFAIHTNTMKKNNLLSADVDLAKLAKMSKNFTGAEIEALVKSATSLALTRSQNLLDFSTEATVSDDNKIEFQDFLGALEEVKPQFGADTDKFEALLRNNIINFGPRFEKNQTLLTSLIEQVRKGQTTQLISVMLSGENGTGKSALAAWTALECEFPFIKLISAENFVGYTELGKVNAIVKVFEDAYRSPLSLVVLDDIERLIELVNIGPRFSNHILQAILVLTKKLPRNPNHRLMVIGTTSQSSIMKDLEVLQAFNVIIDLPMLDRSKEILQVLSKFNGNPSSMEKISTIIPRISIKKLLMLIDMASQDTGEVDFERFSQSYEDVGPDIL